MDREILFRGKNDAGEWLYGYLTKPAGNPCFIIDGDDYFGGVIEETIGQFTGLTDKNGMKIFEDDIIKRPDGKLYVIRYSYGGFDAEPIEEFYKRPKITWNTLGEMQNALWITDNCEVISNIHDNPEFLEDL